jgi:hypothetical protein
VDTCNDVNSLRLNELNSSEISVKKCDERCQTLAVENSA